MKKCQKKTLQMETMKTKNEVYMYIYFIALRDFYCIFTLYVYRSIDLKKNSAISYLEFSIYIEVLN